MWVGDLVLFFLMFMGCHLVWRVIVLPWVKPKRILFAANNILCYDCMLQENSWRYMTFAARTIISCRYCTIIVFFYDSAMLKAPNKMAASSKEKRMPITTPSYKVPSVDVQTTKYLHILYCTVPPLHPASVSSGRQGGTHSRGVRGGGEGQYFGRRQTLDWPLTI